ncbi:RAMP superfamily CRISPR-associated protein [Anaerocellum danielii]|uniref:RAMP superfamily CRISPR-associated protein n=1 Tax=Anaerocellum danielii TaxID=1387557 RepID=A0ABZ0TZA6_9FIRM|nr:RAMP superfamily CRISPR-associated protein [Caldicellulosiruptor danielii]WPX08786.1 RAMP superfamily CRISPR-associated protein [Caldicellulosiruptor danielii]
MKKITYRVEIYLKSPLIISSGETNSIIRSMIIGIDGKPIIPATTLKGIVRSNYVYLHHCQHKIFNCNCEACMLFGSQNNRSSLVFFEDLKPSKEYYFSIRTQTAIDRFRRAIRLNSLFSHKTVENTTFCGKINLYLPSDLEKQNVKEKFEQAVKFIEMIGGSKSRGLGHVEVFIEEVEGR